jgi:hypothetical protein
MATAPTGTQSGWLTVSAPADLQLYQDGRLLGSSRADRIMMPAGRHTLELVSEALGFRTTRTIEVAPNLVSSLRVELPRGSLSVNALPWAEVSVNGQSLGETPIADVALPIGTHEVVFRHPELGERVSTVTVRQGVPTRVSMDMRRQ